MPITPQEIVAQSARRQVVRLSAVAKELGVRDKMTLTVSWRKAGSNGGWSDDGLSVGGAIVVINRTTEEGIERGEVYIYRITPSFPTFSIDEHGEVSARRR